MADGAGDLHDLAETYGEFRPSDLAPFVQRVKDEEPALRVYLLAAAVRGALRHRLGYQEPNSGSNRLTWLPNARRHPRPVHTPLDG
jgi:hypothetical protein